MSQQILDEVLKNDLPEGYEREGVVIPPVFYAVTEKKVMVLGKEVIKKDIEKASGLPEGFIFSEDYTPRLLIKEGKVIAVEILKKV
ncbi:MAG: hypothetical protein ACTSRG_14550 [Candidatus Helarchaeota archaeon]